MALAFALPSAESDAAAILHVHFRGGMGAALDAARMVRERGL